MRRCYKTANVIQADPRKSEGKNQPLQVMTPPDVFDAFSAKAGETSGYSKGSKSQLFMAMWDRLQFHGAMTS